MQFAGDRLVVSPTDLAEFMRSRFASWMTRCAQDQPDLAPGVDATDPEELPDVGAILKRRGFEHEARVVASLRAAGRDVVELELHGAKSPQQTLEAMHAGREIIVQAHLAAPRFAGVADFLVRVPGASRLGGFHYEVWDAKLARQPRPAHILQLCCYADMLETIQGVRPREVQLLLGDGAQPRFRTDEFFYFYCGLRDAFLTFLADWRAGADAPLPDPSADHGRWQDEADRRLDACDHVSRVASCSSSHIQKLARERITTLAGLAATGCARVAGIDDRVFARLREQAQLQRGSRDLPQPLFRILTCDEVEDGKGLALLPPASPGDVAFDLEGDPLEEGGMEYLWGVAYRDDAGALVYRDWWAHDRAGERAAIESFLDWLAARRTRFPDLHVFHYAAYETAVLKRLAGREATREAELDDLLRGGVFVDLYSAVRHGVRVGEPRYGLKNIERLYRAARAGEVTSGMESVVVYDAWRRAGESRDWNASPLLRRIRDYNEEDCRSTWELLDWLRARQAEAGIAYRPHRPAREEAETEASKGQLFREAQHDLTERMLAAIPAAEERANDPARWAIQELLAHLIGYHHRELRPVFWELFARSEMSVDERFEQPDCLANLRRTARPPFPIKQSLGFEYDYDAAQDTKIGAGATCRIAQHPFVDVSVEAIDPSAGTIVLKISAKGLAKAELRELPESLCLVAFENWITQRIEESIQETAERFYTTQELSPLLRDLLLRRAPRMRAHDGGAIQREGETASQALLRAVRNLDASVLCVQGPPGSGKTTESAAVIRQLVADGCVVGVASQSHKAIENLLNACGIPCAKVRGDEDDVLAIADCEFIDDAKDAAGALARVSLLGGTAWCFSRPDLAGRFDYLFIDEASQVSLAKVVAMSRAAKNLVLVGDQMQLSQPTRAIHPGESGLSALDYALAGLVTIPAERGVFLARTHRLHPDICTFVSGAFYEDRLLPAPTNEKRVLRAPKRRGGRVANVPAGIAFLPVAHAGNTQASDEEVDAVRALVAELRGRGFTDRDGNDAGRLDLDHILVVAPYNLQVRKLAAALPSGARVGTVDRFQGQQAPVVIVSMCASEPHLSPRGIGFLFHPNRLNVAISRAQCLSIVVGEPRLATAVCRSVEEMRLVNRMCRLVGVTGVAPAH